MAISDLPQSTLEVLGRAGSYLAEFATPTVRLGVTGLARSGKTVFITALVRNLVANGRLPFFSPAAEGRILRAYLEPQPDDDVPRFAYEEHLAALGADPPEWPESTRRISELRVTIEYESRSLLRRRLGTGKLHIDIIDYPGEWLIDLPMLDQSFATWSKFALAAARDQRRVAAAAPFLAFLDKRDASGPEDEQAAIEGATLFTSYLQTSRAAQPSDLTLGPGRFLMPGDHAGSPLLTFFPLDVSETSSPARGSLAAMMERRYEAYRTRIVRPFFRDHFARLDRQIVLVDALSALATSAEAIRDLEMALATILANFRPGASTWLSAFMPRRIDRIVFAATKADHIHHTSHDRLENLLATLTRRASERATFHGAEVKALALAALRSTEETEVIHRGEALACIVGTPLAGEVIDGRTLDGRTAVRVFPGDIPVDTASLVGGAGHAGDLDVVRFRPARIAPDSPGGARAAWPHIRLDRALDFLIGDRLA